jgi:hypothetical protein
MRNRLLIALVACMTVAALVGCGSSSTAPRLGAGPNVGASISLADCNDWKRATTEERLGTLAQLKDFAGGSVVGGNPSASAGTGAVLDDKQAYDLMNNYCKAPFAGGFKLYKLYERAAAFAGHPAQ